MKRKWPVNPALGGAEKVSWRIMEEISPEKSLKLYSSFFLVVLEIFVQSSLLPMIKMLREILLFNIVNYFAKHDLSSITCLTKSEFNESLVDMKGREQKMKLIMCSFIENALWELCKPCHPFIYTNLPKEFAT